MKITEIFEIIKGYDNSAEIVNILDAELLHINNDSREDQTQGIFFAVPGAKVDGTVYISDVIAKGAVCIVTQILPEVLNDHVCYIYVASVKDVLGMVASVWYKNPSQKLKIVGVTGTNGKTTIARMMSQAYRSLGVICGSIGTLGYEYGGEYISLPNTTPDALVLQKILSEMVQANVSVCIMEVSSIALMEKRVEGIEFSGALFTNLTQDHLDYHKTMEEYAQAKMLLLSKLTNDPIIVVNKDSDFLVYGLHEFQKRDTTYISRKDSGELFYYTPVSLLPLSIKILNNTFDLPFFVGEFNAENAAMVITYLIKDNYLIPDIQQAITKCLPPVGRLEKIITKKDVFAFVDYAHTPDALLNVIETLRGICYRENNIITVFGCGGDRDTTKRPIMGDIAVRLSDRVIITDDNPRTEDPDTIVQDILKGIGQDMISKVGVVRDRKEAIKTALDMAQPHDIVLVAGKGHEQYQIIGKETIHFSDQEELASFA